MTGNQARPAAPFAKTSPFFPRRAGRRRAGLSLRRPALTLVTGLLVLAAGAGCTAAHPAASPSAAPPPTAAHCSAPDPANPVFSHTSGNHLISTRGQVMMPYGVTVFGLALRDWRAKEAQDDRQIRAAITLWCANYIRLQVAPAGLLSATPDDAAYLAAVRSEVQLALSYDGNVILTAQTEKWPGRQPARNPTQQTIRFWRVLAPVYAHNPRVWFDLFNEPRLRTAGRMWDVWQNGATIGGVRYVGMQQLVSAVRAAAGDTNLILAEGPLAAQTLSEVGSHRLTGANVAYAVHPYGQRTPAEWARHFGQAAATLPVVADEWSYSPFARHHLCGANPAGWVPEFFAYLRSRQLGLGVWGLVPGVLVTSTVTFMPTRITGTFTCLHGAAAGTALANAAQNGSRAIPQAQGVGQLVQQYFLRYARA